MGNELHNITLDFMKDVKSRENRVVDFLGEKFIIDKGVFPLDSPYSISSIMAAKNINPKEEDSVLDIGTGTGVQAILAAKRGAAKVLAVDIDDKSVHNAKKNVEFHNLEGIIEVRKSNLFENVSKAEKFDLIILNLPFTNSDSDFEFNKMILDPGYKSHEIALKEARGHLTKKGKILITGGDLADDKTLLELAKKYNYNAEVIYEEKYKDALWKVYSLS